MAAETNSLLTLENKEKEISQLAKRLPKPSNSIISKKMMEKKSTLWQAHLSKISDFLRPGPEVWWKWRDDGSVEFFDAPGEINIREEGPQLYPFRSNNISIVYKHLEQTWKECIRQSDQLPAYKLRDNNGKLMYSRERKCDKMPQITQLSEDSQHSFNVSVPYPERENLHISDDSAQENCEDDLGDTTLEVILEDDHQESFEMNEDITSCKIVDPCELHQSAQEINKFKYA